MPPRRRGKSAGREIGGFAERLADYAARYSSILGLISVTLLALVGFYVRVLPGIKYNFELDANDPWIAYWLAKYFHENGLFNVEGLARVEEFWWPLGRDFLRTEYLGVSWLAAATYPIGEVLGFTLKQWIALFPPLAGALAVILAYFLVVEVTGSRFGGIISSALFAVLPGAIIRTTAGFVEKIGIATPILLLFYYLVAKAFKEAGDKKAALYGLLGGLAGGSLAFFWGGWYLPVFSVAAMALLEPVFWKPSARMAKVYASTALGIVLLALASPAVTGGKLLGGVVAPLLSAIIVYLVALRFYGKELVLGVVYTRALHAWIVAVIVFLGVTIVWSGFLPVSGRILMALGVRNRSPLAESVQEHQPISLSRLFDDHALSLVLVIIGGLYYVAVLASGYRRPDKRVDLLVMVISLLALLLVYANKQLAYFTQMTSLYLAMSAGLLLGVASRHGEARGGPRRAYRRDPIVILGSAFILAIVLFSSVYYLGVAYRMNSLRAPQILTGGLAPQVLGPGGVIVPVNDAWLNMLDYIRENLPEDAIIAPWWDYGYWVTVNTGRPTIADGATLNETHISILARVLVGSEEESSYALKLLKAKPNNTYILFYEIYQGVYDKNQSTLFIFPVPNIRRDPTNINVFVVTHGQADFQKSFQMLRISYKVNPFTNSIQGYSTTYTDPSKTVWVHFPGLIGAPDEIREKVLNTVLYKLGLYGLGLINTERAIIGSKCGFLQEINTVFPMAVASRAQGGGLNPQPVFVEPPKRFTLEALSMDCPIVQEGAEQTTFIAVIVFLYKWLG